MSANITSSYPLEISSEDIPLLSADPELKARGIANASLFEFQALMNDNVKPNMMKWCWHSW